MKSGRLSFEARKHLRRRGKPYRRKTRQDARGPIRDTVFIELRPKDVEQRLYVEDGEVDAVLGKPGIGGPVTLVDRMTRLLSAGKTEDKTAFPVHAAPLCLPMRPFSIYLLRLAIQRSNPLLKPLSFVCPNKFIPLVKINFRHNDMP